MVENAAVTTTKSFVFPRIHDNPSGWGPCEVSEQFKDTPYQPFCKEDRLGKVREYHHLSTLGGNPCLSFSLGSRLDGQPVPGQQASSQ